MAGYGGAARNHQQPGQPGDVLLVADPELRRNYQQQLCLDTGRALLLGGALVTIPTAFDFAPANANDNTTLVSAFVGFVLWILGACLCLLALTPRAGAAVATTLLNCLSPMNY